MAMTTPAAFSAAAFCIRAARISKFEGRLVSGCSRTGTWAAAISSATSQPSAAPSRMTLTPSSRARRSTCWMSAARLTVTINGMRPSATGIRASRSARDRDKSRSAARS
ncbi:hypothetical protein D3C73_1014170 [compost metagenome]